MNDPHSHSGSLVVPVSTFLLLSKNKYHILGNKLKSTTQLEKPSSFTLLAKKIIELDDFQQQILLNLWVNTVWSFYYDPYPLYW